MRKATICWAVLVPLMFAAPAAFAQTETLGDEFIFFVNGTNVLVPTSNANPVNDPLDPTSGNTVARIDAGAWTHAGFAWDRAEGIDATANVGETYGESDTLFFRILSDPANATQTGISIMLSDKTDDSGANDGTADNEFRLIWPIPAWIHDGEWHDLAIPLPPATRAALEDAKAGGDIDSLAAKWDYPGAWSAGGFGIGPGFGTSTDDPLWHEFEWNALYRIGPFWDNGAGGGPIYLDDVYIGGPDTDISTATDAPSAMSGVNFTTDGEENVISWGANPEFGGYNVYASLEPIDDVMDEGVIRFATMSHDEGNEFRHRFEIPHPSLGSQPIYYAVTSLSAFGVENRDISASSGEIVNENLTQKAYIRQITDDQANELFFDISEGIASDEHFPADQPVFVVDSGHRSPGDGTTEATLPTDEDLSAEFKIGYTTLNELFVYGEITDDTVTFAPAAQTGANTWNYDSAEIVFGHYDIRDTEGGNILLGSPHQDMERGAEPDYGIRITAMQDPTGEINRTSTWIGWSIDVDFENASAVERTDTGWKFLTLLPLDQIQNTTTEDAIMPPPARDEIAYIPFIISLNDADGETRETQIVWSIKPNVSSQWWNTPAQWETVAMAGLDATGTAIEDPAVPEHGFSLAQSTPNPAAGVADIAFTLDAPGKATIEVFNMLGQRVTVVADRDFGVGRHVVAFDTSPHAAGIYVYRLSAGDYVATRRMAIVR